MEIEAEQNGAVQRLESDWSCNRNLSLAAAGLSVRPWCFGPLENVRTLARRTTAKGKGGKNG